MDPTIDIRSEVDCLFEQTYLKYLRKDNRLYDDAAVRELPQTFFYNLHRPEWQQRAVSAARLYRLLARRKPGPRILDLGCGTGWLAARLCELPRAEVWGLDVCMPLLQQAARVFPLPNLHLVQGDLFEPIFEEGSFDVVVAAASIEYFPNLPQLINRCRLFLAPGGEVHLLDSPLWPERRIDEAREAVAAQYETIPEMARYHFVHGLHELAPYDFQRLYTPGGIASWFSRVKVPHPWVRIVN